MAHLASRRLLRRAAAAGTAAALAAGVLTVSAPPAAANPAVTVTTVVSGLTVPWDLTWVGSYLLYDLRAGQLWSKRGSDPARQVQIALPRIFTNAEAGLLGIVADPGAGSNRLFYTCQSVAKSNKTAQDVRVLRWRLAADGASAAAVGQPVITGIPINAGRHNGCRLRFGQDGKLYVGTGDAVQGGNPQNLRSLGGKVLRVNASGSIPTDNPFYRTGGNARYVWNYGHRNVQGLAVRPGTQQIWTAEHGTDRDDEINESLKGANYGWNPVPGYDESRAMTDTKKYPKATPAKWRSGFPTVATSGSAFLAGSAWGRWEGALAVAMLKGKGIKLMFLNPSRQVSGTQDIAGLGSYGRIRTVQQGPDGALWFTTSNGGGTDKIGRIAPTARPAVLAPGQQVSATGVSAVQVGSELYVFLRTTGNRILFRRSTSDSKTWWTWADAGVTSSAAPSVASSGSGRIDLATVNGSGHVILTRYVDRVRKTQTDLGGPYRSVSVTSARSGRLDVLAVAPDGSAHRRQLDGSRWSAWRSLGGVFGSSLGASADSTTHRILMTGRDLAGGVWERTLTENGDGSPWVRRSGWLWSARALGDTQKGVGLVGASVTADGYLSLRRDSLIQGMPARFTSDPDVVTRPDGSWIVFGRATDGTLTYVNGRKGQYRQVSLGGAVR